MKPTHRNPLLHKFLLAPSILLTCGSIASADSLVWKGEDATNPTFWDIETSINWLNTGSTLDDVFSAGDTVLFNDDNTLSSPILVAIQAAVSPGGTTFDNDVNDYDVSGEAISSGNLTFSGDSAVTFASAFGGIGDLTVNGGGDVSLGGIISTSGNLALGGTGVVKLNAANSYTGATIITDGRVELGNNAALGTTDGGTTISGTGTLDMKARALGTEVFTISGEGTGDGALINTGAQSLNAIGRLTLAADATIGATGAGTVGRWDLRNSSPTLDMGGFTLTKKGNNTVFLVDAAVSNPGNINILEGAIGIQGTTPLDGGSASHTLSISGGAFVHLYRSTATLDWKLVMEDTSRFYTESHTVTTQNNWTGPVEIVDDGTATIEAKGAMIISGIISGTNAGFEKTGTSSLTLTNANTYSGATTVTAGSIIVKNATALGTAAAGTTVTAGHVGIDDGVTVVDEAITINGNGGNFNGALQGNSGTSEWQGNVTIGSPGPRLGVNAGEFTVSGTIDSAGQPYDITLKPNNTGSATLILSGANTYLGDTYIMSGANVVRLAGGDNRLPTGTNLFFGLSNISGNLDLNGQNQTVAGLNTVSGTTNGIRSDDPATLTVNNAAPAMFSGAMTGQVSLTKSGASSIALRGANTTSGNITVNSGGPLELATPVAGSTQTGGVSVTLGSKVVTVTSTAGLAVGQAVTSTGGTGTVGGNRVIASIIDATTFTMNSPATATGNPGNITFGALTAGKLTFHPTDNGVSNKLTGAGTADLKATFDINLTGADLTNGNEWTLVDVATANYDAASFTVTGFTESPEGTWTKVDGDNTWTFTQSTGKLTLASAAAGYASWAGTYAGSQTADLDYDNDGVENGIEYFLNTTSPGFTASPSSFTGNTATWTNGGNIASSEYGTQYYIQTSPDLVIWTKVPDGDPNLINDPGFVSYTLNGTGKQFVRLVVVPD